MWFFILNCLLLSARNGWKSPLFSRFNRLLEAFYFRWHGKRAERARPRAQQRDETPMLPRKMNTSKNHAAPCQSTIAAPRVRDGQHGRAPATGVCSFCKHALKTKLFVALRNV
jgi:hypothetical protein